MPFNWKFKVDRKTLTMVLLPFAVGVVFVLATSVAMTATDSAGFCGKCHSMSEVALTHSQSVHAKYACNECHAPHNLALKLPYKAKEGTRDIYKTVTKNVPELIHPGGDTKITVQNNCLRCHGSVIQGVNMLSKPFCTDCHRHVPHSPKIPVSKRSAADA